MDKLYAMSNTTISTFLQQDKRWQVGLFISGGLLLAGLLLYILIRTLGWFEPSYVLVFYTQSAESLLVGMPIRLSGLPIGNVTEITLEEDTHVQVKIKIKTEYQRWIKPDSNATLMAEGLFGDHFIQITASKKTTPPLSDGAMITFIPASNMSDFVPQLKERLFPLLEEMQSLATHLKSPDGQLNHTLSEAQQLMHELRSTRQQIDKLLIASTGLAEKKLPASLAHLNTTLIEFKNLAQSADTQLFASTQKLQTTLSKFEQTGEHANASLQEMRLLLQETRPSLHKLLQDSDLLIRNGNTTISNMHEHWPFSGESKPASMPETLPP